MKGKQVAALPYRARKGIEILMLTSRSTRRPVIPKGWPIKGMKDSAAAAREALEEAGLTGKIGKRPIGTYGYWKRLDDHFRFVEVKVYPLRVTRQRKRWPEMGQRQCRWLSAADAALIVDEPGLAALIESFTSLLGRKAGTRRRKRRVKKQSKTLALPPASNDNVGRGRCRSTERARAPGRGETRRASARAPD
ncbi:NUDIX hydrolase [Chelatococcus reniformis]|uniref:Nudix hydrolase domain-containing protein n=1 Tax=Chelatococcus reniformis TaxID=1494448 RepID=A0A916TYE5_9HYPH|nr:NUDIX hydrolase [Chelatococcus reniformis]GGC52520.1 hypothetical protein GCM10010994_09480 [Chelatococcus reniformis]